MVRLTRLASSSSCQPLRRASRTRSAIISIAVSRSRSSHSVPYGRRYRIFVTRVGLVTSCLLALPLGQSRPRLTGESGLPSIWTIFPSFTYTFCAQPTAQYGQTLWATLSAVAVRATTESVALLRAALPRPRGSLPVSWRYTGQLSSQVVTPGTLPPEVPSGTPTLREATHARGAGPESLEPVGRGCPPPSWCRQHHQSHDRHRPAGDHQEITAVETVVVRDRHEDRALLAVVPGQQEHGEPRQNHTHDRGTQPTKHARNGSTRAPPDRRPTDGGFGGRAGHTSG